MTLRIYTLISVLFVVVFGCSGDSVLGPGGHRALRKRLLAGEFNLLHSHQLGDHLFASLAKRGTGNGVVLVRSLYDPEVPSRGWRHRLAFGQFVLNLPVPLARDGIIPNGEEPE